jgi:hypothetical protein
MYRQNFVEMLNFSPADLINKSIDILLHPDDIAAIFENQNSDLRLMSSSGYEQFNITSTIIGDYTELLAFQHKKPKIQPGTLRLYISKLIHEIREEFNIITGMTEAYDAVMRENIVFDMKNAKHAISDKNFKIMNSNIKLVGISSEMAENKLSCLLQIESMYDDQYSTQNQPFCITDIIMELYNTLHQYATYHDIKLKIAGHIGDEIIVNSCKKT